MSNASKDAIMIELSKGNPVAPAILQANAPSIDDCIPPIVRVHFLKDWSTAEKLLKKIKRDFGSHIKETDIWSAEVGKPLCLGYYMRIELKQGADERTAREICAAVILRLTTVEDCTYDPNAPVPPRG